MTRKSSDARTVGQIIEDMPAVAGIGDNGGPPLDALPAIKAKIDDLETEAKAWFDGEDIANEAQAEDVSRILDDARKLAKEADNARKVEKEPHLEAGRMVDARWKPLTTNAERIEQVAKAVLTPWLKAKAKEKEEAEAAARRAAEAAAEDARRAAEAARESTTLDDAKARDEAIERAEEAQRQAAAIARETAGVKGQGMARAVALRTTWKSEITDRRALLNHVAVADPDALVAFLEEWAARAVRAGARDLPGVRAYPEQVAA